MVNSIDVQILESFPVQVNVLARGDLPDVCTQIDEIISQLTGDTFRVAITTFRQPGLACAQTIVPFEQSIPLDVEGLEAGTYNVLVNGVSGSFTLAVDNVLEDTGTGEDSHTISGFVWHDVCSQTIAPRIRHPLAAWYPAAVPGSQAAGLAATVATASA